MPRVRLLIGLALLALLVAVGILAAHATDEARRDPVTRVATIALPDWPAGEPPLRVLLWSDLHLGNETTDAPRLARLVARANALRPDIVLLAGDFIAGYDPAEGRAMAPTLSRVLSRLRPRLATVAVLGNHDHWSDPVAIRRALETAGVRVLVNEAAEVGPLAIGGADDNYTGHDRVGVTEAAMRLLPGAKLLMTHSPDLVPGVAADVSLVLAGHTHCGQIMLPIVGPPFVPLRTGTRYLCGMVREGTRTTIVTGGTGTSRVPMRLGAPPDWWLLTLGPRPAR